MATAAFIISVLALLVSAASVIYIRQQAVHAAKVATIEADRRRVERTPDLIVQSTEARHDDPSEHETSVDLTNGADFTLCSIEVAAVTDRPDKQAILAVNTGAGRTRRGRLAITDLAAGQTTSFNVLLAHEGARSDTGVLQFTVEDANGDKWVIEREVGFPRSPRVWVLS